MDFCLLRGSLPSCRRFFPFVTIDVTWSAGDAKKSKARGGTKKKTRGDFCNMSFHGGFLVFSVQCLGTKRVAPTLHHLEQSQFLRDDMPKNFLF